MIELTSGSDDPLHWPGVISDSSTGMMNMLGERSRVASLLLRFSASTANDIKGVSK